MGEPGGSPNANRIAVVPYDVLTDEQREIRDLVRTLARERVAPRAAEIDKQGEFPWDMVELFREHELLGLPFEEQYGGTGTGALMVHRRGRGAVEGLRDDRPDHGRAGARLARHQARRDGRAEGAVPAAARERRVASRPTR